MRESKSFDEKTYVGPSPHFNSSTNFTYNNVGQPLTVTDALGVVTKSSYDSFGNVISTVRDAGDSTHRLEVN